MRIAFVIPGSGGGGVRSIVRIAKGLIQKGHQVRIAYRAPKPSLRDRFRNAYLAIRFSRGGSWLDSYPGESRPYDDLTPHVVGDNDIVIGVGVACVLAIADLPGRCGIKVHNCRGVEPWRNDEMTRAWALPMPRIVVGSHLVLLMRAAGSDDLIFVARNGVDRGDYFPSLPESARDGVGAVFHGGSVKDPDLILETINRLAASRPALPLYMFGSFPRPQKLPGNTAYARFPSLARARELYSRSLVWFLASRNEGLPNPLLEGAACGCALVSTDCGGASDIIENEKTGLIVPVGDAQAMTTAIERLLDDAQLRARFIRASQATVERLTWPRAVEEFESALIAIAGGSSSTTPSQQPTLASA